MVKGHEMMMVMIESVLSVFMRMEASVDDGAARAAGSGARECHIKERALFRNPINVWRPDCLFSIASNIPSKVVSNEQQDIPGHRGGWM